MAVEVTKPQNQELAKDGLILNSKQRTLLKIKNLVNIDCHHMDIKTGMYKGRQLRSKGINIKYLTKLKFVDAMVRWFKKQ